MEKYGFVGAAFFVSTLDYGHVGAVTYVASGAGAGGGGGSNPSMASNLSFPVRSTGRTFPTHEFRAFPHE